MTEAILALLGGPKAIERDSGDIFDWPIVTAEDEAAVLDVLRRGAMSGFDVTEKFEREYAEWQGAKHALGFSTGTAALQAAMYGCKVGVGDEIIAPSVTYWASLLQCFSLGATVVFADVDPDTLCIDPHDIEHRITERTKAIVVVHYCGHPAEMDAIMEIARRRNVKVIEDVSHAHGGLYKGKKVGSLGDVAGASLMSGKSLVAGEAGMLTTDDLEIFERAVAWGFYRRFDDSIQTESLKPYAGLPLGGYKYRMHQMSSAVGRVQLKSYDARMAEIQKAMNAFCDLLEGIPGIHPHRPPKDSGSTNAGWYAARAHYRPEELGGLSVTTFTAAVRAEGVTDCHPGANPPLHLHPLLNTCDVYGHGKPTRIAHSDRDVRQPGGSLPNSEKVANRSFAIPWFKHYRPEVIEQYAQVFSKVAENHRDLLEIDQGDPPAGGAWGLTPV
jgi:dTDP-4-amino-4,6-dideoxygalactose transaminase